MPDAGWQRVQFTFTGVIHRTLGPASQVLPKAPFLGSNRQLS